MPALAVYEVSPASLPRRFAVRETTAVTPPKPRLLDRVRSVLRARHYSRRTEDAYVAWIKRYIFSRLALQPDAAEAQRRARSLESAPWRATGRVAPTSHEAFLSRTA